MSLKDKVIFMSGGSRGIGLAMAKRAAQDGAKVAVAKAASPSSRSARRASRIACVGLDTRL